MACEIPDPEAFAIFAPETKGKLIPTGEVLKDYVQQIQAVRSEMEGMLAQGITAEQIRGWWEKLQNSEPEKAAIIDSLLLTEVIKKEGPLHGLNSSRRDDITMAYVPTGEIKISLRPVDAVVNDLACSDFAFHQVEAYRTGMDQAFDVVPRGLKRQAWSNSNHPLIIAQSLS